MGEVRAVSVSLFWAIIENEELLAVGETVPGNMTGSEKEFLTSDSESGVIALLASHGISEAQYLAKKEEG